jgi:hypothetical protein
MPTFAHFVPYAPIDEQTVARFAPTVPPEVVSAWREHGSGYVSDGYFRLVDPGRAAQSLEGTMNLPEGAAVLFTTALGDLVVHLGGRYLVVKFRWGVIDVTPPGTSFAELVRLMDDPAARDLSFEWSPYLEAARRTGVPALDEVLGFVPMLALGGPPVAENLRRMGLWEHLAIIAQMAGVPSVRGDLRTPETERPVPSPVPVDRSQLSPALEPLAARGEALFRQLATKAGQGLTDPMTLVPFDDGVAVVRAVRGGATIFVGPDQTVLYSSSAMSFEDGVRAFRAGRRTAPDRF